jgi:FeS assembly SUF system protein
MTMEPFGEDDRMERSAREGATSGAVPEAPASAPADAAQLEARLIDAVSTVYDPEIPVNIYELGLIYDIDVQSNGDVHIAMTLTSPACPVAGSLPGEVESRVAEVDGVGEVTVELVWDPPWTPDRMSEAARLELGFM